MLSPRYEIRVRGRLSRSLVAEFERLGVGISDLPPETVLAGRFEDPSALYGMLRELEGLALELIDVRRMPDADDQQGRARP